MLAWKEWRFSDLKGQLQGNTERKKTECSKQLLRIIKVFHFLRKEFLFLSCSYNPIPLKKKKKKRRLVSGQEWVDPYLFCKCFRPGVIELIWKRSTHSFQLNRDSYAQTVCWAWGKKVNEKWLLPSTCLQSTGETFSHSCSQINMYLLNTCYADKNIFNSVVICEQRNVQNA